MPASSAVPWRLHPQHTPADAAWMTKTPQKARVSPANYLCELEAVQKVAAYIVGANDDLARSDVAYFMHGYKGQTRA